MIHKECENEMNRCTYFYQISPVSVEGFPWTYNLPLQSRWSICADTERRQAPNNNLQSCHGYNQWRCLHKVGDFLGPAGVSQSFQREPGRLVRPGSFKFHKSYHGATCVHFNLDLYVGSIKTGAQGMILWNNWKFIVFLWNLVVSNTHSTGFDFKINWCWNH